MEGLRKISIPTHTDERGNLSVIELKDFVDWEVKRIYYVTDVQGDRGGHVVLGEKKIYVCVQGSITAKFHDGKDWHEFKLEGPGEAIILEADMWREFTDFSDGAVLMAVSSTNYEPDKYIYELEEFLGRG